MLRGVRALQIINGSDISGYIKDHVKLIAGSNINLTQEGTDTIRIDALSAEGMNDACICDDSFPVYPPIKTINGVPPNPEGQIFLTGGDCVVIQANTAASALLIQDRCSTPCCGCEELEAIVRNMSILDSSINRMTSNLDKLAEKQTAFFNMVLLASI
jgi:hypothetical protein